MTVLILSFCMFQSLPLLRFNREGNLLAVTTADDGFKILANAVGLKMFKVNESTESATIKVAMIFLVCFVSYYQLFFFLTSSWTFFCLCLNRHLAHLQSQMLVRSMINPKGALLLRLLHLRLILVYLFCSVLF